MSEKLSAVAEGRVLASRPGSSRKLLLRKARGRTLPTSQASLEASFPPGPATPIAAAPVAAEPTAIAPKFGTVPSGAAALPVTAVTDRGNSGSKLCPGEITPNAGTVVEAIVRLVVERGELSRAELIGLMSGANFAHPKARPAEKGWSQGYVAGAIRNGFLNVMGEHATADAVTAPDEER